MKKQKNNQARPQSITLTDLLASIGIPLTMWAEELEYGDFEITDQWRRDTARDMLILSEVLTLPEIQAPELCRILRIVLPPHMYAVTIKNPLYKHKAEEEDKDNSDLPF